MTRSTDGSRNGTGRTPKIDFEDNEPSRVEKAARLIKPWHVVAVALVFFFGGAYKAFRWFTSVPSASAVENVTQRVGIVEEKQSRDEQDAKDERMRHDQELRWINEHMMKMEGELGAALRRGRE